MLHFGPSPNVTSTPGTQGPLQQCKSLATVVHFQVAAADGQQHGTDSSSS